MSAYSTMQKGWQFLVLTLFAIGFIVQLVQHPSSIILPLAVVSLIYYLYKHPPGWLIKLGMQTNFPSIGYRQKTEGQRFQKKNKTKKHSFRVIDGKKKKSL